MNPSPEVIAQDNNRCGEGPIWDASGRRLIWTDIEGALLYQFHPATGEKANISRGLSAGGIGLNRTGELVLVGATGVHLWRGQDNYRTLLTEHDGEALAFNDMIVDPRGRVYAGTFYWGADGQMEKHGKLYLIDPDGSARVVADGIELSNGLGFSSDNRTLYSPDSSARRIDAYDVQPGTGTLSNRRTFVRIPSDEGLPDGLTVDAEDHVWSAQWYGAQVVRYDPDGKVERRVPMPVTQVSAVAFGGDDLTDLYVTTAADSWPSHLAPPGYDFDAPNIGGSLYRLRLGIRGKPEHLGAF